MPIDARLDLTVTEGPDVNGWKAAQSKLIQVLGSPVEFRIPTARVYPDGTPLDPETGEPYDPTIEPESGGNLIAVSIVGGPVFRSVQPEDPIFFSPSGVRRDVNCAIIVNEVDYPSVQNATEFALFGVDYKLTEFLADGLVDVDRYIAYGEAK